MSKIEKIPLSRLEDLLRSLNLPDNTTVTLPIEDNEAAQKALRRHKALEAMKKLKGSGNGNLVVALLKDREKDALL
jgi:hypothetical protein